jgi:hypothetical protein
MSDFLNGYYGFLCTGCEAFHFLFSATDCDQDADFVGSGVLLGRRNVPSDCHGHDRQNSNQKEG